MSSPCRSSRLPPGPNSAKNRSRGVAADACCRESDPRASGRQTRLSDGPHAADTPPQQTTRPRCRSAPLWPHRMLPQLRLLWCCITSASVRAGPGDSVANPARSWACAAPTQGSARAVCGNWGKIASHSCSRHLCCPARGLHRGGRCGPDSTPRQDGGARHRLVAHRLAGVSAWVSWHAARCLLAAPVHPRSVIVGLVPRRLAAAWATLDADAGRDAARHGFPGTRAHPCAVRGAPG